MTVPVQEGGEGEEAGAGVGCLVADLLPARPPAPRHTCPPLTEQYTRVDCGASQQLQRLVAEILTPADTVLEVGARYGAVSCSVAAAQRNSGRLVSVEAECDNWATHRRVGVARLCRRQNLFEQITLRKTIFAFIKSAPKISSSEFAHCCGG